MNDLMTKSFLSYVELKKQALKDFEECPADLEARGLNHADEKNLSQFFEEVSAIKSEMEGISNLLVHLQELNEERRSTHSAKILRGLRDQMDSDMVAILRKAKLIKTRLEALDEWNITNRSISPACKEGSPLDRTRTSVTSGLRVKLRETLNQFQSLREKIVTEHKEELRSRYFNATGLQPSEETLEKMTSDSGQVEGFEKAGVMDVEMQERQEGVKQIRKSLMELHQVILDMAILVEGQEENMDDIEKNMGCAAHYISGGTNHLAMANNMKKRGGKCVYWVWIVVLLLLCVLCLILVFTKS